MQSNHPTYTIVSDPKEADAVGWGFYSKSDLNKPQKIYFKFPELQSDEVRIKIHYTGLCYTEVHMIREDFFPIQNWPVVPGHEIVGEITHVGKDVDYLKEGEIVGFGAKRDYCGQCRVCKRGEEQTCMAPMKQSQTYGEFFWGGYATAMQQPAKMCHKIPSGLDLSVIPPLFCAGITVFNPLSKYCKTGYNVGVNGLGGLGHLALKFGKGLGCNVTCFTRTKEKVELCKQLGADNVVVTSEEGAYDKVAGSQDVIINTVGELDQKGFDNLVKTMGPGGVFVQVGASKDNLQFNALMFLIFEHKYVTSMIGSKKQVKEMLEFALEKKIVPMVEKYDFDDMPKAWDKLVNGKPEFRCVVKCLDGK